MQFNAAMPALFETSGGGECGAAGGLEVCTLALGLAFA